MIDKITNHVSKRYVIVSLVLVLLVGITMLGFVSPYFSAQANGLPYMETKFFYTPGDLLEMAEGYGTAGRSLYVRISLSLDLLVPLLGANFLTALALYLSKKPGISSKWRKPLFALGIAMCASDWIENLFMISILKTYPKQYLWLAVMGRVMTSIKYLMMVVFVIVIIREVYFIKKKTE